MKKTTAALLASAIFAPTMAQDIPSIPAIPLSEFVEIRDSDASAEFGGQNVLFDVATKVEWIRILTSPNESFPFLFCMANQPEKHGFELKEELQLLVDVPYKTMINKDDLYCAFGRMTGQNATTVRTSDNTTTLDDWTVQPMLSSMKILRNSIELLDRLIETVQANATLEDYPSIDVVLCPGVTIPDAKNVEAKTDELLQNVKDALMTSLSWWTGAATITSNAVQPPRGSFWEGVIDQSVEKCRDTFDNRLIWGYTDPLGEDDEAIISLSFNVTGANTVDAVCAISVLAALASRPETCSVETRQPANTYNLNAQWLTQTGVDGERPFFDAGILGKDQLVAVSDTGIDFESCYFRDTDNDVTFRVSETGHSVWGHAEWES